eukprot:gene6788-403_t
MPRQRTPRAAAVTRDASSPSAALTRGRLMEALRRFREAFFVPREADKTAARPAGGA